jgi:hypothetical protein
MPGTGIGALYQSNAALANKFFGASPSWARGTNYATNPVPNGLGADPSLAVFSYAKFVTDVTNGAITFPYRWVDYDPESWAQTPQNEQNDPWTFIPLFCDFAHAHGFKVMVSPARDLGNVTTSVNPKLPGEDLSSWYLRTNIAAACAAKADAYVIQDQTLTTDVPSYVSFTNSAHAQAQAAGPQCKVMAHLSTSYGTPAQMNAAIKAVTTDGCYVQAGSSDGATLSSFFSLI